MRSAFRGESWDVISEDLTKADSATLTTGKGGDGNIQYATITSLDESPLKPGLLWVGTDDGNVHVTQDDGLTWELLNDNIPNNPEYWVSRVEASHHALGTAYVSYTGYRRDDFRPFVYKTTDFGESWTDISSNLPSGPINVIREHHTNPDLLFVGTEFQVWVSIDGGGSWTSMKLDMPTAPVHDMKIHPRENDLVVATHGRGIFISDISPLAELTPGVLAKGAHFFEPEPRVRWVSPDLTNYSSSNFNGESEPEGVAMYYYLSRESSDSVTFTVYQNSLPIAEIRGAGEAGIHRVLWSMEKRIERSATEQDRLREGGGGQGGRGGRGGGGGRGGPSRDNVRYAYSSAPEGRYLVVMSVDGQEQERSVTILKDEWWMDRR
ncbi:MAG TPA: hypothetical protein EYO83_02055 [Gemmatimonadetes bacterium]|nr:hypothetical protein [Gemmatimonadota bacterium]